MSFNTLSDLDKSFKFAQLAQFKYIFKVLCLFASYNVYDGKKNNDVVKTCGNYVFKLKISYAIRT